MECAHGLEMQGAFIAGKGGFVHHFRQCRVGVADTREVFAGGAKFHRHHGFGNQFGGIGADDVHAEDAVGFGVGQHLDEAAGIAHAERTAIGGKGNLAGLVGYAVGLELLFGLADPGDLGAGVDDPRDGVEIAMTRLPGHHLGDHDALFHGLVREHRAGDDIADRPHAGQVGTAVPVDVDAAALVENEADGFGVQALGIGDAPDGDDQTIVPALSPAPADSLPVQDANIVTNPSAAVVN